jgi:hypothetical protein
MTSLIGVSFGVASTGEEASIHLGVRDVSTMHAPDEGGVSRGLQRHEEGVTAR